MQKTLLLAVLLLCASWVMAQSSSTSGSSSPSSSSQTSGTSASPSTTGQSGSASDQSSTGSQSGMNSTSSTGSETSIEGCLSGSNGSFTLTDNAGTAYQLTGDNSELSKHVNEEVRLKGTQSASASSTPSASNPSGSASSSSTGSSASASGSTASHSFDVTSVKKVSDTCTSKK